MEKHASGDRKVVISREEISRLFRLTRQTLAMHHTLRDRYQLNAVVAECLLLATSVIFCTTTFAEDYLYKSLGIDAVASRVWLGIASVTAFIASVILLVLDFRGGVARHSEAAAKWSTVLKQFRENLKEDGSCDAEVARLLSSSYWDASENTVAIPDSKFNALKKKYLLKVELSKRISDYPGAPRWLLWLQIRSLDTKGSLERDTSNETNGN